MQYSLKEILEVAKENNFAVPAFNVSSIQMLNGVMETCAQEQSPVIIEIHPTELEHVGDGFMEACKFWINNVKIPATLHLDHGGTLDDIRRGLRDGCHSVMIDASMKPYQENIEITQKVVEMAHAVGVSVEAELGTIGNTRGDNEIDPDSVKYTDPEDAVEFVNQTDCDALAVAIGTGHGLYPEGYYPKLKLDLLKEISKKVEVPLVLHGGSSNSDEEIQQACQMGINKVNISSDIKVAFYLECREVLKNMKLREPKEIYPRCIEAMNKVIRHKIDIFGAKGAVKFYN